MLEYEEADLEMATVGELMAVANDQINRLDGGKAIPLSPSVSAVTIEQPKASQAPGSFYATKPATTVTTSGTTTYGNAAYAATPEGNIKKTISAVYRAEKGKQAEVKHSEPLLKTLLKESPPPGKGLIGCGLSDKLRKVTREEENLRMARQGSQAAAMYGNLKPSGLSSIISQESKAQFTAIALMGVVKIATVAISSWSREKKVPYELIS